MMTWIYFLIQNSFQVPHNKYNMPYTTEGLMNVDYNINESLAVNDLLWGTCTAPAGGENWNNNMK